MFRLPIVALLALAAAHDPGEDARLARRLRSDRYRPTVKPTAEANNGYDILAAGVMPSPLVE